MSPVLEEPLWASGSWVTLLSGEASVETSRETSGGTVTGGRKGTERRIAVTVCVRVALSVLKTRTVLDVKK